jgi:hypothetical protein
MKEKAAVTVLKRPFQGRFDKNFFVTVRRFSLNTFRKAAKITFEGALHA